MLTKTSTDYINCENATITREDIKCYPNNKTKELRESVINKYKVYNLYKYKDSITLLKSRKPIESSNQTKRLFIAIQKETKTIL